MTLPCYPKYKDSGVEWLGDVPEQWTLSRGDAYISSISKVVSADSLNDKEVFHYSIPVVQASGDGQLEDGSEIDSSKLLVERKQVLISKLNPRKNTVCLAQPHDALTVCSGEFVPLQSDILNHKWLYYLVGSENFRKRLESLVESATRSHQRVNPTDILKFQGAFPSALEQTQIARFLDHETARIDALIDEQQRLIELLKEKRQAVISHAVTKGLDPTLPMKDTGINYIGRSPVDWRLRRLGDIVAFAQGKAHEPYIDDDGDYICVNSRFVSTEGKAKKYCSVNLTPASLYDILMVMSDLPNGRALARAYYVLENEKYAVNQRVCRITAEQADSRFLFYLLNRHPGLMQNDDGVHQTHLSNSDFQKLKLFLPSLPEQSKIAHYLDHEIVRIDALISEAVTGVELLQERRSALISAAVTGKIDVRGWQPPASAQAPVFEAEAV